MKNIILILLLLNTTEISFGQSISSMKNENLAPEKPLTKQETFAVKHKQITIDEISIFYREAGNPQAETILMLHGFPSSSHMYRNIIDGLSEEYHIIAPDYPGFGFSDIPSAAEFEYSFDNIAQVMEGFIKTMELESFYLMIHDYGGPIGLRIATQNPNLIKGLIIQNANSYTDGFGELAQQIGSYVENKQFEELAALKNYLMSKDGIKSQYTEGAKNPENIDAVAYLTDNAFFDRENVRDIQKILFDNYGTNFPKYAEWQNYFRTYQPPTLVIWGENDKFFSKAGGEAYQKDLKNIDIHFFDAGHFLLEEYPEEAESLIREFLSKS